MKTMLALAKKYKVPLTAKEAKSYYRAFAHENEEMKGGIAALKFIYPLLREKEDWELLAYEVLEDAKNSGLRYVEFFWNPSDAVLSYKEITKI